LLTVNKYYISDIIRMILGQEWLEHATPSAS
jgi:hypothetical protein